VTYPSPYPYAAPQPQYPQQPGTYPYPPQQPGPYAPQGQYPPAPPADPGPPATLNDFMSQPASAGGKSLSFNVPGTRYVGTVIRNVTNADIERATEVGRGGAAVHPDGRPKLVMKVPLLMAPSAEYPTGVGVWYVKASERGELARAMEAAGESGAPKAGDVIEIVYTHDEPTRAGMSPRKVKRVTYTKGNGQPPELPQAQAAPQQPAYPQQFAQGGPVQPGGYPSYPAAPAQGQPGVTYYAQTFPVPGTASAPHPVVRNYTATTPPPTAAPPAPAPGASPTGAAFPSSPGAPPPDWPADVPFVPGLTPEQARIAATMRHPAAAGQ
jgi:hypothetical protein